MSSGTADALGLSRAILCNGEIKIMSILIFINWFIGLRCKALLMWKYFTLQMDWSKDWKNWRKQQSSIKVKNDRPSVNLSYLVQCQNPDFTEKFHPLLCAFFCLLVGLMEHTKRLLRAFFELSQTHRGESLRSESELINKLWLLGCFKCGAPVTLSSIETTVDLHRSQFISASVSYILVIWKSILPAFGDVFSVIGVREPQAAASEAFVKFADAHRNIEKYGIQLLKTIKPVSTHSDLVSKHSRVHTWHLSEKVFYTLFIFVVHIFILSVI